MEITSTSLKSFRIDFEASVKELAIKHGVQINLGDIKYGNDDFHAKLTVKNSEVNGVEIEEVEFNKYANIFGFEKTDYNRMVMIQRRNFRFVGFKPRSSKNVCKIRDIETGKNYSCSEKSVKGSYVNN
jgi:hypothetical protein